ncbi:MAG TPA: hypothetical protein VII56_05445 [Rhizomicrobium sp.]
MSANVTINFASGSATSSTVEVMLSGCTISPSAVAGASVSMASALTNISVFAGQVMIATAYNAQFNGSLTMAIGWTSGQQPSVTLNNISNPSNSPATVMWPTANGPQIQILSPGNPLTLNGIVSS